MLNKKVFKFFPRELIRYIDSYIPYQQCIICNKIIVKYSNQYYICSFFCYNIYFFYKFKHFSYIISLVLCNKLFFFLVYLNSRLQYIGSFTFVIFKLLHIIVAIHFYLIIWLLCAKYFRSLYFYENLFFVQNL